MKKLLLILIISTTFISVYAQEHCKCKDDNKVLYSHGEKYYREDAIPERVVNHNVYKHDTIVKIKEVVKTKIVTKTIVKVDTVTIQVSITTSKSDSVTDYQCKVFNKAIYTTLDKQTKFMIDSRLKTKVPYIEKVYYNADNRAILIQKLDPSKLTILQSTQNE